MKDDSQHGNCTFTERLENISFATVKNVRYEHLVEESVANKLQGNSPINRICIFMANVPVQVKVPVLTL